MQSTQVFANRALDRAVAADGLRTGYYNPNPADARIPDQTDIVLEEFLKRPSSETANPTQKKQMAQAIMRTATIHSPGKDAAYQQVGATKRDIDHFTCMEIIRNVSNYLIENMITNQYRDWGHFATVQGTVSSLVDSNISKKLTELQRLAGITPENFTDWFVEAVYSLKDGLNKPAAWYWRDQEERAASASASSAGAGGGGVQAGAGGRSLGASEDGEGFFGEGPQPKAAAVAHDTITDQRGNQLPLHGDQGVYTVFKIIHGFGLDEPAFKDAFIENMRAQFKDRLKTYSNAGEYLEDLYNKLLAYDAKQAAEKAPPSPPAPVLPAAFAPVFAPQPQVKAAAGAQLGPVVAVDEEKQQQFLSKWFFKPIPGKNGIPLLMPLDEIQQNLSAMGFLEGVRAGDKETIATFIESFLFSRVLPGNSGYSLANGICFPLFFKFQKKKYPDSRIMMAFLSLGGLVWRADINDYNESGTRPDTFKFNIKRAEEVATIIEDAERAGARLIFIPGTGSADDVGGGSSHWYSLNIEIKSEKNIEISVFHTGGYNDELYNPKGIYQRMQELTRFLESKGYTVENLSEVGTRMQKENESCAIALMGLYKEFFNGNFTNLSDIVRAKNLGQGKPRREKWVATDTAAFDFREFSLDQEQQVVKEIIHEALHEIGAT